MNKISKTCEHCSASFEITDPGNDPVLKIIARMQKYCGPCSNKMVADEKDRIAQREQASRQAKWNQICPPIYRETDFYNRGLNQELCAAAAEWNPEGNKGLGFMGPSRIGKTRLLFFALERAFKAGRSVAAISHIDFCELVLAAASGPDDLRRYQAEQTMDRLRRCDVLLLDDVGKAPTSPQRDAMLYSLLERRSTYQLPILWCSNGHGQWLTDRFGADRGTPIVSRLAEFSHVVKVGGE